MAGSAGQAAGAGAGSPEETFGERIRRLRVHKGLTQRALAEPGYTAAYVSSVEAGRREPSGEAM
ncbi:MAG: helix-turn-helix transcriptional regulator, partial [Streptomycetaceae bacterium]|nr:helix-turn-helix transcriptional regulator [Streptomycetaceae bacterium]